MADMNATSASTIVMCVYKFFPHGGMQRAFLRIAGKCQALGYHIKVFTLSWEGPVPEGFDVITVNPGIRARTNHARHQKFISQVQVYLQQDPPACVVGFNKMPGLDVYYAADTCYLEKATLYRRAYYRRTPRFRHFSKYEKAVFGIDSSTEILMMSEAQKPIFQRHYGTPDDRFHMLPPGIGKDRMAGPDARERRSRGRLAFNLSGDEKVLLFVGSGFITKGLDRCIRAVAALPAELRQITRLIVVGHDRSAKFAHLARRLNIAQKVSFVGGRDDIPDLLQAADLLVHPAYIENTGNVLLEATVAGLPVLTTAACGFAHYITDAESGLVVPLPFEQSEFDKQLAVMLTSPSRDKWRQNGIAFGKIANLYGLPERAADVINQHIMLHQHG